MQKETVTFDKLPEAVGYLTEQIIELKKMVSELQPPASDKHVLVEIEDACRIIRKAKPTIYTLVRKGLLPAYKKGKKLYFYEDELLAWKVQKENLRYFSETVLTTIFLCFIFHFLHFSKNN